VPGDILEISIPTEANERECGSYHQPSPTKPSASPLGPSRHGSPPTSTVTSTPNANMILVSICICASRTGAMIWIQDGDCPLEFELIHRGAPRLASKHRGYAFLTFANPADAQDAIDNYDLNELPGYQGRGKFLKCNIAQPNKYAGEGGEKRGFDRPGTCGPNSHYDPIPHPHSSSPYSRLCRRTSFLCVKRVRGVSSPKRAGRPFSALGSNGGGSA
jgi:hypothetical protein